MAAATLVGRQRHVRADLAADTISGNLNECLVTGLPCSGSRPSPAGPGQLSLMQRVDAVDVCVVRGGHDTIRDRGRAGAAGPVGLAFSKNPRGDTYGQGCPDLDAHDRDGAIREHCRRHERRNRDRDGECRHEPPVARRDDARGQQFLPSVIAEVFSSL